MIKITVGMVLLLAVPSMSGAQWQVCVEDGASLLSAPVRGAMLKELQAILGGRTATIEFERCRPGDSQVTLTIESEPPPDLPKGVLGLAHREGDRIEPELQVFHGPLMRYLGRPNNAFAVGRALARVAAHEASHFLGQQVHHCEFGLMRAVLPAHELLARDRWPFRRDFGCGNSTVSLAKTEAYTEGQTSR